jgi:hypothetical protein
MLRHKNIIVFLLLLCCTTFCLAQTNKNADDDNGDTTTVVQANHGIYRTAADTAFIKNDLIVPRDSMRAVKKTTGFEYADSLDAQLRKLQKDEEKKLQFTPKSNWLINILTAKITACIFWAIAIAFVGFLLYNLFLTQGIFARRYTRTKSNTIVNKEEAILTAADYDKLIAEAVNNKNYRLGIRYLYLQSLQLLANKGVVTFAVDKVNYQYVRELQGKPYKTAFAELTLNYEYIWYGEFYIDEENYLRISNHFKQFNNQL